MQEISSTPYDDVFKTLLNDCSSLVLPLINEVFGEHYTGKEKITFQADEFYLEKQDGTEDKIITDSHFTVEGPVPKHYHWECESKTDRSMLVRLFQYDSQIALRDYTLQDDTITVRFPNTAVLYLRSNSRTPDHWFIKINAPDGQYIRYPIPTLKVTDYSVDAIFEKELFFLIPFYIFNYEKILAELNRDETKRKAFLMEYKRIRARLDEQINLQHLSEYTKATIRQMTKTVSSALAEKYPSVSEGVENIMGGRILDYEAKDILNRGREEGHEEGEKKGMNVLSKLMKLLFDQGRMDEVYKMADDPALRDRLLKEFKLA